MHFWPLLSCEDFKKNFHYEDSFIFTSSDSYYFTRYAREHVLDSYGQSQVDHLRNFPDGLPYPNRIPLISWITSQLHSLSQNSIDKLAFYMPPILAVLFVLPLWAYSRYLGSKWIVLGGAILGVTSLVYISRTTLGRFDTDCLNLFFLFLIGYLLQRSSEITGWRGITLSGLAGLSFYLFNWWYSHPEFLILYLFIYFILLFLNKGKNQRDPWWAKIIIFVVLTNAFNISLMYGNISKFIGKYISPQPSGYDFPNIIAAVAEAQPLNFWHTLTYIGNIPISLLGMAGLVGLIIKTRQRFLGLVPILLLGLLSFRSANRFAMYLAPFVGMGIGFWAVQTMNLVSKWTALPMTGRAIRLWIAGLLLITCFMSVSLRHSPVATPESGIYKGLRHLAELEGPGAVWTWWDWGYAIQEIAKKATYADGGFAGKSYFIGLSLAERDPKISHNVILGVTNLGYEGIYEEIQNRNLDSAYQIVKEIKDGKYNSDPNLPIYLVFTGDMISKFSWINYIGTWDFQEKTGEHTGYIPLEGTVEQKEDYISAQNASIDLKSGYAELENGTHKIKSIRLIDYTSGKSHPTFREIANYGNVGESDLYLQIVKSKTGNQYFLLKEQVYQTLFHQMFILNAYDRNLFELVHSDYPFIKIFRVKPENEFHQRVADVSVLQGEEENFRRFTSTKDGILDQTDNHPRLPSNFSPTFENEIHGRFVETLDPRTRVIYTLDPGLNQAIKELFSRQRIAYGSFVAMEPRTGRVLALVEYADQADARGMIRRATYPAASVFKLVTAAAVLEKGVMTPESMTQFRGGVLELNPYHWIEDSSLDDNQMTLTEALSNSCIPVIARIALKWLSPEELYRKAEDFGFNEKIDFELPINVSRAPLPEDTSTLSYTAAGFGDVSLSPIHGAMIAAMIANQGVMMAPRLIEQVIVDNQVIYAFKPHEMGQRINVKTAGQLREMMLQTVIHGTAHDAFRLWGRHPLLRGILVGGKTGTLDGADPPGEYNWFIGMAPLEDPQIAVAAMVIHQPPGGSVKAADVARYALKMYFMDSRRDLSQSQLMLKNNRHPITPASLVESLGMVINE